MIVVFLGPPGAGKGTQCKCLVERHKLIHLSSGDILRRERQRGSELGKQASCYMDSGKLVPDELIVAMMMAEIGQTQNGQGFVLDGFPRNLQQAEALDTALARQGKAIDKVVYIKVSQEELLKRLSGRWVCRNCQAPYHAVDSPPTVWGKCDQCGGELYQRPDDTSETVAKRLEVYFTQTAPLMDYYIRAGKLLQVNGEGSPEEVENRIITALRGEEFVTR